MQQGRRDITKFYCNLSFVQATVEMQHQQQQQQQRQQQMWEQQKQMEVTEKMRLSWLRYDALQKQGLKVTEMPLELMLTPELTANYDLVNMPLRIAPRTPAPAPAPAPVQEIPLPYNAMSSRKRQPEITEIMGEECEEEEVRAPIPAKRMRLINSLNCSFCCQTTKTAAACAIPTCQKPQQQKHTLCAPCYREMGNAPYCTLCFC